jgi:hypothetical protein
MPSSSGRRMPLSCEPCRERKIKCARNINRRGRPCETCVRRGIPSSDCVYLRDQWPRRHNPAPPTEPVDNSELVARIDRLEGILRQSNSMPNPASQQQPPESVSNLPSPESTLQPPSVDSFAGRNNELSSAKGVPSSAPPAGVIVRFDSGHERFEPSSSRWSSVLRDNPNVSGIKTDLDGSDAASMPFSMGSATIVDLLALLPPTSHCEQLKKTYFDVFSPVSSLSLVAFSY